MARAQSEAYKGLIKLAEQAYKSGHYDTSALYYSGAFMIEGGKGTSDDRYNAACSWALIHRPDSAFYNLFCIVQLADYRDYTHLRSDPDLISLHSYKAWGELCRQVKQNMKRHDPATDTVLADELREMHVMDQLFRNQVGDLERMHGRNAPEVKAAWDSVKKYDAINLRRIRELLDKRGWPSRSQIGPMGVSTVFLVLQHADSATQIRYLPMLKQAVETGNLPKYDYAMYFDRVNLRQGKKQMYGSQVRCDDKGCEVLPLEDPLHVDERRRSVGLGTLADYVKYWNITWNAEEYARKQGKEDEKKR